MSSWHRFQSQFRETYQERRDRLRAAYRQRLAEQARNRRREECATCPPADAIADERRCTDCPWRSAQ